MEYEFSTANVVAYKIESFSALQEHLEEYYERGYVVVSMSKDVVILHKRRYDSTKTIFDEIFG